MTTRTDKLDLAQFEGFAYPDSSPIPALLAECKRLAQEVHDHESGVANLNRVLTGQREQIAALREALTLAVYQFDNLVGAASASASDKLYGPQGLARAALAKVTP